MMDGPLAGLPASSEIHVRQCTSCGRADLREWFPSSDEVPAALWECQLCERSEFRTRDLRKMLAGRLREIVPEDTR